MLDLDSALIVDRSRVMRHILTTILKPHARRIDTAVSVAAATAHLDASPSTALVLCAIRLDDGDGFDVIAHAAAHAPASRIVLMTHRPDDTESERAIEAGALGILAKPISMSALTRIWTRARDRPELARSARVRDRTRVRLVDAVASDERLITWSLRNLSTTGAFIETQGPLEIDETLELEIEAGARLVRTRATVVRLQEPTWLYAGGVGVRFGAMDDASREALAAYVAAQTQMDEEAEKQRDDPPQADGGD